MKRGSAATLAGSLLAFLGAVGEYLLGIFITIMVVVCGMFSSRTMQLLNIHSGQRLILVMRKLATLVVAENSKWRGNYG